MVLVDASTRWSYVDLLSTRNHAFSKLIAQIIRPKASFPDNRIQSIRMDNAGEFRSKAFDDYCLATGIKVEHSVPHVHTQNGLAESLIKRIKWIARPLLQNYRLPTSCWGHAVLHAAALTQLRPTAYHESSPLQLVRGKEPSISHLRIFGSTVYVPIPPPQRTSMGPHRKLGIYVGYETPSIIKYLEPMTGDLHTARYADCVFDEDHFSALGGERHPEECREIEWNATGMQSLDPRTSESELEVRRIIHLQSLANELPDAFTDHKRVTRSHIPAVNAPERVQITQKATNSIVSPNPRKRGRPPGAQDKVPRRRPQRKGSKPLASLKELVEEVQPEVENVPEVATQPEVEEVPEGPHPKDGNPNASREEYRIGRSERHHSVVSGNHDEWEDDHEEIATNYVESGVIP
jgi:hypothetical protein